MSLTFLVAVDAAISKLTSLGILLQLEMAAGVSLIPNTLTLRERSFQ